MLSALGAKERLLLQNYSRPIVHMRSQITSNRFGLVFGAGLGKPLRFPNWHELVNRIAEDPAVGGKHLLSNVGSRLSDTAKTQMLFQHFKSKYVEMSNEAYNARLERRIQAEWRRIIQKALYDDVDLDCKNHPFLSKFLDIIKQSRITVNYNFDDTIENMLGLEAEAETYGRNYETIWNANLQFRPDVAVIYHPNGFLPRNILENPSETLIFSEDTFADQLIHSMAGHHASLLNHLSKTTCLFVGLSLQDGTLRHLLRQSALINPGHYHYYIHYVPEPVDPMDTCLQSIKEANFWVYNLVTLFLTNEEIAALGDLLSINKEMLRREAEEMSVPLSFYYYLTGAVGAGKTTCVTYLGSMRTYKEWTEPSHPLLAKAWSELSDTERVDLDRWIAHQFNLKNFRLLHEDPGIHVVDRSPLDPLSFTPSNDIPEKVQTIKRAISPGSSGRCIQTGHVILLEGDPDEMEARVVGRNKESKAALIADMQQKLATIFSAATVVDTTRSTVFDVVKRVAHIIVLEPYSPLDLSALLNDAANWEEFTSTVRMRH